ncbi:MAG TPA: hypothetical protein VI758_08350, partial [Bacteroidota bacterium]
MPQKTKEKKKSPGTVASKVYIVGESPMVEEYAELCAQRGYDVLVAWNDPPASRPKFTSGRIKPSASIPSGVSVGLELTNTNLEQKRRNVEKL